MEYSVFIEKINIAFENGFDERKAVDLVKEATLNLRGDDRYNAIHAVHEKIFKEGHRYGKMKAYNKAIEVLTQKRHSII